MPRSDLQRVVVRDVTPRTPEGHPAKAAVGDPVTVRCALVRDGHGVLGCRVRWRRVDGPTRSKGERSWSTSAMGPMGDGTFAGTFTVAEPGRYEFEVQAWLDRFATWRRDVRLRASVDQPLEVEFEVGARILESLERCVPKADRPRLRDAVDGLRSPSCSETVRLGAGLDDAVAAMLAGVPDPEELASSARFPLRVDRELAVRGAWYEFFPRSEGGFVDGASSYDRLEAIAAAGFDVVYLPPIHPIGRTHRKGRNNTLVAGPDDVGSPWAIGAGDGGHTAVHPDLGTLADVDRFIARAGDLGVEIALDYALQCSPDHPWAREHPEWFTQLPDGSIRHAENPPKKYQDIYPINFWPERESDRVALWEACEGIAAFWAERGVRVFRVDNPHTKPVAFWAWMIPRLQARWPDLVFLAEAFTAPTMMHTLAEVGFSQSYTYFTWRTARWELEEYGRELVNGPAAGWFRPNFWPNTPDILSGPLRDGPPSAFALRAVLAATMSPSWGVYSGYELYENDPASETNEEYSYSEKYELKQRDWDRPDSLMPFLSRLNAVRRAHRSLWRIDSLRFHHVDVEPLMAYSHRSAVDEGGAEDVVIVVVNLDPQQWHEGTVHLDTGALGLPRDAPFRVRDELTGEVFTWQGAGNYVRLDPMPTRERPWGQVAHVLTVLHD
jgi:starch synthase (maltosyl-transferring)